MSARRIATAARDGRLAAVVHPAPALRRGLGHDVPRGDGGAGLADNVQENMFLYDFWNAPFGVRVEHAHRLYGAAVGLATVVLTVWFLLLEPRRWLKGLGVSPWPR